ncbi:hypothetical protein NA78x_000889 [Anatilimnocola sp. NA78]|uniref:hypothetical protein n=1 Tax=Anatilimnocola sp. NA78 TaxID=3415683 RepID=UPI003CE5BAA7
MKNTTDQSTGNTLWSARPEPATEPHRAREMPLLFQLADINRVPPAPPMPAAPVAAAAAPIAMAPISMSPLPSGFPTSAPFAAFPPTTFSDPWPKTPSSLYEMAAGLSTTALTMGLTTSPVEDRPQLKSSELKAKPAAIDKPVIEKPVIENPVAEKPVVEKKAEVVASPAAKSTLPTVIDTAVKAAAISPEVSESKVEPKAEVKVEAKAVVKSEIKTEVKADAKTPSTVAAATDAKATSTATTAAAVEAAKPSPGSLRRQRAEARQQKVEGKSSDWFGSHGKIIAIGFVIALVGTIYLARRNQPVKEVAEPQTAAPVGLAIEVPGEHNHDHSPTEAANTAPRLVESPSHPMDTTPSPAAADQHSPANSTADLHPPVVPSGEAAPASNNTPLFPWQQPGEARVATRPEAPTTPAPAAGTAPAPSTGPTLNGPQYPETNLRDAPLLPPAPPAEQGRTRVPSRTSPASFTSTPGGNRYERTGSGLY